MLELVAAAVLDSVRISAASRCSWSGTPASTSIFGGGVEILAMSDKLTDSWAISVESENCVRWRCLGGEVTGARARAVTGGGVLGVASVALWLSTPPDAVVKRSPVASVPLETKKCWRRGAQDRLEGEGASLEVS